MVAETQAGVNDPIDLSICASEPIRIPGAIQPHGALLVVGASDTVVTHASANLADFLGVSPGLALGQPLAAAIGGAVAAQLLAKLADDGLSPEAAGVLATANGRLLHLHAFRSGGRICIDIERDRAEAWQRPPLSAAQAVLDSFKAAGGTLELCGLAVKGLKLLTGYDRVMAYRFADDGHGEVIAEACDAQLTPYLGQRYPASDIPAQARAIYLRQRVGVIADSAYEPVPLLAAHDLPDRSPVDLTHSHLRSVSPVHRQFMRNMGTTASMTIGLAQDREPGAPQLWGMLVCHHETPRIIAPELRATADLIGQVAALLISGHERARVYAERSRRAATLRRLVSGLEGAGSLLATLTELQSELLGLVDASGAVVRYQGEALILGATPPAAELDHALSLLRADLTDGLLAVDDLPARCPALSPWAAGCSGALVLTLGAEPGGLLVWFRAEESRTVTWGGNPVKSAIADPVTGMISPRASFAAWQETVRGRSLPWTEADLGLAVELRQAIEAELARRTRQTLDLFTAIFESSPTAALLIGSGGEIRMINDRAQRLFGYARDELVGQSIERLVPQHLRASHRGLRSGFRTDSRTRVMGAGAQLYASRSNGSVFPVEIVLSVMPPSLVAAGSLYQISVIDVTEQRERELEIRRIRDRLQSVTAHMPAMIGYWNRELVCEFANEGFRRWFGLAPEDLVGMSMRELLGAERFELEQPRLQAVLAGQEQHFDGRMRGVDGTEGYLDSRYLPDIDEAGGIRGFYVFATDITELHAAQLTLSQVNAELVLTNRELDDFVYTASHDLRAPLRAIASLSSFTLEDDRSLGTETVGRVQMIQSRARRMQSLLDDVLTYARAGRDRQQSGQLTSADRLVEDVVALLSLPSSCVVTMDPSLATCQVRPNPLTQVFQNLIGNAVKHHDRQNVAIRVGAVERGDTLRFSVADDGPGIPPEYREHVFEMFSTLRPRDAVEGSGMGLALVRKLVRNAGGSCGITGSEGRGTEVWFDWPGTKAEGGS